jgi:hypothetical protein
MLKELATPRWTTPAGFASSFGRFFASLLPHKLTLFYTDCEISRYLFSNTAWPGSIGGSFLKGYCGAGGHTEMTIWAGDNVSVGISVLKVPGNLLQEDI